VKPVKVSAEMKAHPLNKSRLAMMPDYVNPFAVAKFPEPLADTSRYYGLIRPYSIVLILSALPYRFSAFSLNTNG
jgi:hypothetical protein